MEKMLPKNLVNYIIEVKDGFDPFENKNKKKMEYRIPI